MNDNYINEHGVIIGGDETVLAVGRDYYAAIRVAQHPGTGKWAYGVDVRAGGTAVDSFGFSFAPSVKRADYATRDAAVRAAKDAVLKRYRRGLEWWCSNGRQRNPVVMRAIKKAIGDLTRRRQLSLFPG